MRRQWLIFGLAAALPLAACVDEEAGPTVVSGRPAIHTQFDMVALGIPSGDAQVEAEVVELDTVNHPEDLFGRQVSTLPLWKSRFGGSFEITTDYGRKDIWAPRWYKKDDFGTRPDDPRKPFLVLNEMVNDPYPAAMDHIRIRGPESYAGRFCPAGPCWTFMADLDVIGPDGAYVAYGFVRYGVKVNGLVDHLEVLVDPDVPEPDELVVLGGAPGGTPERRADAYHRFRSSAPADACAPSPGANANPFILGHSRLNDAAYDGTRDGGANYDGESDADFCFNSGGLWSDARDGPLPLIAPNELKSFDLPQYNYFVVWEFDPATNTVHYDRPLLRAQIGIDLDLNGNPIPHAFAPFPFRAGHAFSAEFKSREDFLADTRVAAGAGRVKLTVDNLGPLASGSGYQIWLVDEVERDAKRIGASLVVQRQEVVGQTELGDPIVEWVDEGAPQMVQEFNGAAGKRFILDVRSKDLKASNVRLRDYTHVVLSVGQGGDASPLEAPAPVFYRYTDQGGTRQNAFDNEIFLKGSARFGFDPEATLTKDVAWAPFGGGTVEFLNTEAFGVKLKRVARPPLGYFYNVWLVNEESGARKNLGEVTTPAPEFGSLRDADIQTSAVVTDTEILHAAKWTQWAEVGTPTNAFTHVYVTLEPKAGSPEEMSPTILFKSGIPKDLEKAPVERAK